MIKQSKGITLIALVITIIILLILAGVAIAAINKTKLFEKAELAKQESEKAETEENGTLTDYEEKIREYTNNSKSDNTTIYNENIYDCWNTWIYLAGEEPNLYKSSEILNNKSLMKKVMNSEKAMNYLINSQTFIMPAVMKSEVAKEEIKTKLTCIPNMTSDTTPSGEAKASSISRIENSAYKALTGIWSNENLEKYGKDQNYYDTKTWNTPNSSTIYPSWLQYKFENKKIKPVIFEYMSSYSYGYGCVHKIKIQGSNNETDWKDLTEEIECQPFTKYELYPTKNIDKYQYYRLNVLSRTETWGNRTDILIFQVYGYEE